MDFDMDAEWEDAKARRHARNTLQDKTRNDEKSTTKDLHDLLEQHKNDSRRYTVLQKLQPLLDGATQMQSALDVVAAAEPHDVLQEHIGSFISPIALDNGGNDIELRFVHGSVSEFLLSQHSGLATPDFESEPAPVSLSDIHARLLKKYENVVVHKLEETTRKFPFLEYACLGWIYHLTEFGIAKGDFGEVESDLDGLLSSIDRAIFWLQMMYHFFPRHPPAKPSFLPRLFIAAFFDYELEVRNSLADGKDANQPGPLGGTALIWAADADSCNVLRLILEQYKPNLELQYGNSKRKVREGNHRDRVYRGMQQTALHRSLRGPHSTGARPDSMSCPAANMLLEKGARQDFFGKAGNSGYVDLCAWVVAITSNPDCGGVADIVLAILRWDNAWGQSWIRDGGPLHLAARHSKGICLERFVKEKRLKSQIPRQEHKMASLHVACCSNNLKAVEVLIAQDADVNQKAELNRCTPFHFTVLAAGIAVQRLLDHKADPSIGDRNGNTLVHAATIGYKGIDVQKFVNKGFDLDLRNNAGETALACAVRNSNFDFAKTLLDLGAKADLTTPSLSVLNDLPLVHLPEDLLKVKKARKLRLSFDLCRQSKLPPQILARIFRLANTYETIEASHEELRTMNEIATLSMQRPYIITPPILGRATSPVHEVSIKVSSKTNCPRDGLNHWPFIQTNIVDRGTKNRTEFVPGLLFGWNSMDWAEFGVVWNINIDNVRLRDALKALRPGDGIGIIPRAHYSTWEHTLRWARIRMTISVLPDEYTLAERKRLWGPYSSFLNEHGNVTSMHGHADDLLSAALEKIQWQKAPKKSIRLVVDRENGNPEWKKYVTILDGRRLLVAEPDTYTLFPETRSDWSSDWHYQPKFK